MPRSVTRSARRSTPALTGAECAVARAELGEPAKAHVVALAFASCAGKDAPPDRKVELRRAAPKLLGDFDSMSLSLRAHHRQLRAGRQYPIGDIPGRHPDEARRRLVPERLQVDCKRLKATGRFDSVEAL
jgi:hypothetical protein